MRVVSFVGVGVDVTVGVGVSVRVGVAVGVFVGTGVDVGASAVCVANCSEAACVAVASSSSCDGPQAFNNKMAIKPPKIENDNFFLFIVRPP